MLPDEKVRCPYTAFSKTCYDMVVKYRCPKYVSVKGKDPQSDAIIERFGCADTFQPLLLIENSQQQHQTAAAVESLRNEAAKANKDANKRQRDLAVKIAHTANLAAQMAAQSVAQVAVQQIAVVARGSGTPLIEGEVETK